MRISTGENLNIAIGAVWSHRFRALLTILGIVIGITTVVTVASLLAGVRQGVVVFFQEFGPDNIFLSRYGGDPSQSRPNSTREWKRRPILPEYAQLLLRLAPSLEDAAITLFIPNIQGGRAMIARVRGYDTDAIDIAGVTVNTFTIQPRELTAGRVFTQEEAERGARVAILGAHIATALFPDGDPVGKTFLLDGAEFTVLGVHAEAKGGLLGNNVFDRQIAMPYQTARMRYPQTDRVVITLKALPGERDQAYEQVQAAMRKIRRVPPGVENDFSLTTPDQIVKQFDQVTGMIVLVSIAISAVGLLVGGIGVMNIMLVSVTERTREIGVRKAIGARRSDIVFQFLMEAITLTGAGGVLGIVLAVVVTLAISALFPTLPSEVPPWAAAAGFLVSVIVGLFFGVWPAVKAARLDPVEALRYE